MNKKCSCLIVSAIMLLNFTGCKETFKEPTDDTIKKAPAYVVEVYNQFNDLAKKHELSFRAYYYTSYAGDTISFMRAIPGETSLHPEDPEVMLIEGQGFILRIRNALYEKDECPELLPDIVTALFMMADSSLSIDAARKKSEELISSRPTLDSETRYSKIMEAGDSLLWFKLNDRVEGLDDDFYCMKKSALFTKTDDSFKELNKENAYNAQWDGGGSYKITAKVEDFILTGWTVYSSSMVEGADGQKCYIAYDYGTTPIIFEVGKTYTFYGRIMAPVDNIGDFDFDFNDLDGRSDTFDYPVLRLIYYE